jgi:hypothetical protein
MWHRRYFLQAVVELPLAFLPRNFRLCQGYAHSQGVKFGFITGYLPIVWQDFCAIASGRRAAEECRDADQDMLDNAY